METGLQRRLGRAGRQIAAQHRHLKPICAVLTEAIRQRAHDESRAALERYRTAITAHFTLEDGVFFPAVHGLHPEHAAALNGLSGEHRGLLERLDAIGTRIADGRDFAGCAAALLEFSDQLTDHERREEALVGAVSRSADED